ncbi:hypothetical protein [Kordia sp.]|uniref:hypothetical protein n=1 Tax=Kordia sp. TaxID=1965332 RepID=UPI003B5CC912
MSNDIDIRRVNLGTCFNARTREIKFNSQGFDIEKLAGNKLIRTNRGDLEFHLTASSDNDSKYQNDFFGTHAKAEFGLLKSKVGVGFSMQKSSSKLTEVSTINCKLSNKIVGQNIELLNLDPHSLKDYYNCLMPGVKRAYEALMNETDLLEKLKLHNEFIEAYGTGFISRLFLESGAIANIIIKRNSESTSSSKKYGITAAASFKGAGVSNANEFGKTIQKGGIEGSLEIHQKVVPHDSPAQEWITEVVKTFTGEGVKILTESTTFSKLPKVTYPKLEPFPKKDAKKEEPPKNKGGELDDKLKQKIMKTEDPDFTGNWDEWIKKRKEEQKKETDLKNVISETEEIEEQRIFSKTSDSNFIDFFKPNTEHYSITDLSTDHIKGYAPTDFVYTPWSTIFPDINSISAILGKDMNISKVLMFHMSRIQFSQFLQFADIALRDIGNHPEKTTKEDLNRYNKCLDTYTRSLRNKVHIKDWFNKQNYSTAIKAFKFSLVESKLKIVNYELFYQYYNYIAQCPFGMILHHYKTRRDARGNIRYFADKDMVLTKIELDEHTGKQIPYFEKIIDKHKQIEKALRIYLLPSYNKYKSVVFDLCFYYDSKNVCEKSRFIKLDELKINSSVYYKSRITEIDLLKTKKRFPNKFIFDNKLSLEPTHIGFKNVDFPNLKIPGPYPMFENFPFDLAGDYSKLDERLL